MLTVERPIREVVRLFNVEDTSLFTDIARAKALAEAVLKEESFNVKSMDVLPTKLTNSGYDVIPEAPDMYVKQIKLMNDVELFRQEVSSRSLDVEMFSSYQTYFSQADGYSYEDMDEFELVSSTVREDDEDMMFI